MVLIRKTDGSLRLCIDFRKLNSVTDFDPYDMPLVDKLLDRVGDSAYISKDLTKGFYQIPVEEVDRPKTAFCTPWGKFHFGVCYFGLRNAPAKFQRAMHDILNGLEEFLSSYIDDILI